MATYVNAPGVSDEKVEAALLKAAEETETIRQQVKANPGRVTSSHLFLLMQCRAENVVEAMGITDPTVAARQELVVIAKIMQELQGILVEEMSEIIGFNPVAPTTPAK